MVEVHTQIESGQWYRKPKRCRKLSRDATREERMTAHKEKMHRKAQQRIRTHIEMNDPRAIPSLLGVPASINRHTGKPHEHLAEKARRTP